MRVLKNPFPTIASQISLSHPLSQKAQYTGRRLPVSQALASFPQDKVLARLISDLNSGDSTKVTEALKSKELREALLHQSDFAMMVRKFLNTNKSTKRDDIFHTIAQRLAPDLVEKIPTFEDFDLVKRFEDLTEIRSPITGLMHALYTVLSKNPEFQSRVKAYCEQFAVAA